MSDLKPILLIEDDQIDAMTVERALGELGVTNQLVRTTNGEEALEYLRDKGNEKPCVILSDINMPKMDGVEFLKIAKADEELKNIPVVVFTSSKQDADEIDSLDLDIAGYIAKADDCKEFIEQIKAIDGLSVGQLANHS